MSKTLVLRPRLSEQTYAQAQTGRVYVFDVPASANKHSIAQAVVAQFEVKVVSVNITNIKGKAKRTLSLSGKRSTNSEGRRSDVKKAYVKLAEGNSLPIFAAVEEEEAKVEATQEKIDKVAAKQAQKETKSSRRGFHLPTRKGARGGDK